MRRRAKGTAAPHVVQYPYLGQRGLQGHSCLVDQGPCPRLTTPANAEPGGVESVCSFRFRQRDRQLTFAIVRLESGRSPLTELCYPLSPARAW
jgi:hypothetical protein